LWNSILKIIQERIWLGYGFGAFWLGWNGASARVWAEIGWQANHGHNGFLDLWLHLGLLGLLIYLWGFAWVNLKAIKLTRMKLSSETIWPLAMLTFLVIYNFTGSVILNQNSLEWVLYVAIAYTVSIKQHKQHEEKV
jgi:O-antigen ligase